MNKIPPFLLCVNINFLTLQFFLCKEEEQLLIVKEPTNFQVHVSTALVDCHWSSYDPWWAKSSPLMSWAWFFPCWLLGNLSSRWSHTLCILLCIITPFKIFREQSTSWARLLSWYRPQSFCEYFCLRCLCTVCQAFSDI